MENGIVRWRKAVGDSVKYFNGVEVLYFEDPYENVFWGGEC